MKHAQGTLDFGAAEADSAAPDFAGGSAVASRRILGMRVDATSYEAAANQILLGSETGRGGMVCASSVNMVMEGQDDPEFQKIVNAADLVTPDGVPLVWALRWLGIPQATRVYGPALTEVLCERAAKLGIPVGFYGGAPEVVEALHAEVVRRYPGLEVVFRMSPPFRPLDPDEDAHVVEAIRASDAGILFVGLGCPKQERWMIAHREALDCVMVGVGAAFDFISGAKPQAPAWLQRAGLEWLFRLVCEPRRLWHRSVVQNPRFVRRFAVQLWREGRVRR